LQQSKGKAWDCSPLQLIWDQSIRTIAEKRRPEYEYRPTRHRIWSREIAGRRRCGLGLPSTKKVAWNAHRPDVTKIEARYRTPELTPRPIPAPIAAEAIRPSAHLPHPKSLNTWDPVKPPELQVAPLKFIGPAFGISIPEPLPLR